ncbi:unnamed protein product [Euphydryas editha]|uniref:Uncharacterized protein n=1 Tax=Euphydryas editha TaxID=104508 RepID=A0AAU9UM70_EUPED|nr:unnamed protein product [Euphydryas editha]
MTAFLNVPKHYLRTQMNIFRKLLNNKENESFPERSQLILQKVTLKRKFVSSRTCLDTASEATDSSLDKITDTNKRVKKIQNKESINQTKTSPQCCNAKKKNYALFAKDLRAELNTDNELPPIYAQFEHDKGIVLAFRLRNVPANRPLK